MPTSNLTEETVTVDGFVVSQSDHAGITTTQSRQFTSTGMTLTQTDGRENTTTTVAAKLGRTLTVTDAAGNVISTTYCVDSDNPSCNTNAQGKETHYRYDVRGRKVAEWGTAIQPACFSYDDADRLVSLTTFRADEETISSDPSERTDGDTTTWSYHPATGLELTKTYADGSCVSKTYGAYNRLATETDARGVVKTHSYEVARGLLLSTSYSDGIPTRSYTYNHLSQLTRVVDAAGTRKLGYNAWGEQQTDSLVAHGKTHLITELRDEFGRSSGYTYKLNNVVQQSVNYGYGADGRLSTAGFTHRGVNKQFPYTYLPGSNLLHTLTMPNKAPEGSEGDWTTAKLLPTGRAAEAKPMGRRRVNITLTQQYEPQRDLLTSMVYTRGETTVAERTYAYDTLGRPTTRTETCEGNSARSDSFSHNDRSELTAGILGTKGYYYSYDNIGNRKTAKEDADEATNYDANALNQYTAVGDFVPEFDADGNQTKVQTSTGIWNVTYNAENRPTVFSRENEDGTTTQITCAYDYMGRRATKKVETIATDAETEESTASTTLNQRYLYRGYLQVACCDLTRSAHPCLWFITWDPTQSPRRPVGGLDNSGAVAPEGRGRNGVRPSQPVATRPLAIRKDGTWYCYGWDLTKNVCEVFSDIGTISNTVIYSYTPYGAVTASGTVTQSPRGIGGGLDDSTAVAPQGRTADGAAVSQPIQWSSEFYDDELGLVYYNYRYFNPSDGRWTGRDFIQENQEGSLLLYGYKHPIISYDYLGLVAPGFGMSAADSNYVTNLQQDIKTLSETKPTTAQSLVPVIGSLHEGIYAYGQGELLEGTLYMVLAASDILLIKSIVQAGSKIVYKSGSHTWKATRKWYGKQYNLPPKTEVHHWLFHQKQGIGKYVPEFIKNQPWNLRPVWPRNVETVEGIKHFTSKEVHLNIIHAKKGLEMRYVIHRYEAVYPAIVRQAFENMLQHLFVEGIQADWLENKIDLDIELNYQICEPEK